MIGINGNDVADNLLFPKWPDGQYVRRVIRKGKSVIDLKPHEIYDSILVPGVLDESAIRLIDNSLIINKKIFIGKKEYTEIFIYNDLVHLALSMYLEQIGIKEYYLIKQGKQLFEQSLYLVRNNPYEFEYIEHYCRVTYDRKQTESDIYYINRSKAEQVSRIEPLKLFLYSLKHEEVVRIKNLMCLNK